MIKGKYIEDDKLIYMFYMGLNCAALQKKCQEVAALAVALSERFVGVTSASLPSESKV